MSDFIKVNLMSGYSFVAHKNNISMNEGPCGKFYVTHLNWRLSILSELLTQDGFDCKKDCLQDTRIFSEITREEYERICKELGVEG